MDELFLHATGIPVGVSVALLLISRGPIWGLRYFTLLERFHDYRDARRKSTSR